MTNQELEKIYNESYRAVYWTAMSLLKNEADAEDIVQETFLALIKSYDTIADKSKVNAWLKKTAANKCLDRIKLTKTVNVEDEFFENVEDIAEDFLPDSLVESAEMRKVIMDIIEKSLSEEIRKTLILYYFDEMTTKEISEVLGVPQGTVLWRLNYAKKKIKKEVEKYEKDNDTKLFMVVPFLTSLFTKEAEQVLFKPMPASLLSQLSASTEAAAGEAAATVAAEAVKKGAGSTIKKVIIGSIVAVVAVGAIIGISVGYAQHTSPKKNDQNARITEENDGRGKNDGDDGFITAPDNAVTHHDEPAGVVSDASIYVCMEGMTAEECVENIWKTTNVYTGMTRDEYSENIIKPEKTSLLTDDKFAWVFDRDDAKRYIATIEVYSKDECDATFEGDDAYSHVHLLMHFDDEAFTEELIEKIIERYQAEGYEIKSESGSGVDMRYIDFQGNERTFSMRAYCLTDYVIEMNIPLIGK
ncbi:MAG: sigma-70 family RNA polymerase sigma factor [Clostridiales bacterium]|nr:sigma-70 family RNA polymerase sigma factor [Clostridiales bacterium]